MALSIVNELLEQYIQSLFKERIVNDQFRRILNLKTVEEPDRVVQLIDTYCTDVEKMLLEIESSVDLPEVDFRNLEELAREMEEKSSYIGAEHVRCACADLIQACREMSKKNFDRALSGLNIEFGSIQSKLEAVGQMERKIIRLERKQKK